MINIKILCLISLNRFISGKRRLGYRVAFKYNHMAILLHISNCMQSSSPKQSRHLNQASVNHTHARSVNVKDSRLIVRLPQRLVPPQHDDLRHPRKRSRRNGEAR